MTRLPGLDEGAAVAVIGGGGALGGSLALALNAMGVRVALVGRTRATLEAVAERAASTAPIAITTGDVSDRSSIEKAMREVHDRIGPFSGMVNAASVMGRAKNSADMPSDEAHAVIATNLLGAWESVRATVPLMRTGGSVILVSSVAAHRARAGNPLYGATKAGVVRLVKQFAHELGDRRIRVNSISPGQTPSQLTYWDAPGTSGPAVPLGSPERSEKAAATMLGRRGRLEDYVGPTLFLLSDLSAYITGADLPVDGGLLALM